MAVDLHHRGLRMCFAHNICRYVNADISWKLTCLVALLGYIFLVSFPDKQESLTIRFLTAEERQLIVARVNQDRGDADLESFTFKKWLGGASDWKIWAYGLCKLFGLTISSIFSSNNRAVNERLCPHYKALYTIY